MYDNVCKRLVESFPEDFSTWLLGKPVVLTELKPTELSIEPIRADSVLLRQSEDLILHVEFQTRPEADIPLRMLDYWVRLHRRYPDKDIHQVVIYLKQTDSPLVRQNYFQAENISSQFNIIRLWEQPTELFINSLGLLPFAVLSCTDKPVEVLYGIAKKIEQMTDTPTQGNLAASCFILAGLLLKEETITQLLRRDIMQDSVTYQLIVRETEARAKLEGKLEGKLETIPGLVKLGLAPEQIATALELDKATILEVINTMS